MASTHQNPEAIYIDRFALIFGMTWLTFDMFESRHAQIKAWQREGFVWHATYKLDSDTVAGLCHADVPDSPEGQARLSGAALIAAHPKVAGRTALVMIPVTDDDTVFVGVQRGVVILDALASNLDENRIRNKFFNDVKLSSQESPEVVDTLSFEDLIQFGAAPSAGLGKLIGLIFGKLIFGKLRQSLAARSSKARLQKFKSERDSRVVVGVLALGLIGAIGWWLKSDYDECAQKLALNAQQAIKDPRALYSKSVSNLLKSQQALSPVGQSVTAFRQAINGMGDVFRGGWQFTSALCEVETQSCRVKWTRMNPKVGTFETFTQGAPTNWQGITLDLSLNELSFTLPVDLQRTGLAARDQWPSVQQLLATEGSRWQRYAPIGFELSLKEATIQALPAGVQPSLILGAPNAVFAAGWEVSNKPLFMAEILENTQAPSMSLDAMEIKMTGKEITFSAKGKVYVRKS